MAISTEIRVMSDYKYSYPKNPAEYGLTDNLPANYPVLSTRT